jgi:hypothetical protein
MSARILIALVATAWIAQASAQTAAPPATAPTVPPATEPAPAQPTMGDDKDTIAAAQKWLELLDAGKFGAAWDVSSAYLKSVVTRKEWIAGVGNARKPLGKVKSRTAEKFARSHSLPGAPDGDYSIIEFDTLSASGKRASEQVIWVLEAGDIWRVSGYFIR